MNKTLLCCLALICLCLPETAMASGGITELTSPLQKVIGTITGPAGRLIAAGAIAICAIAYVFGRNELSEGFKMLLNVILGISFIALATNIVDAIFSFSGAIIA